MRMVMIMILGPRAITSESDVGGAVVGGGVIRVNMTVAE